MTRGWNAHFYSAFGVHFEVRSNSAEILRSISANLPPGTTAFRRGKVSAIFSFDYAGPRSLNRIFRDDRQFDAAIGPRGLTRLLDALRAAIQLHVAEMATSRLFIHAAVVAWNGRAIVIPGRTHVGKSRLVVEFVKAGGVYYSDEYAVIDKRGRVHPYLKPIHWRDQSPRGKHRSRSLLLADLGAEFGKRPVPVGWVVLTEFREGAVWRPRRISGGNAGLGILQNSLSVRRQPDILLRALEGIVSSATVYRGRRGEAVEVVRWFIKALN